MRVFYWGHLVGTYGFFKGREQCLQSQLGLVIISQRSSLSRPWLRPSGNRPVVYLYGLLDTLPVSSYTVTMLFGSTCRSVMVYYLEKTSRLAIDCT